MNLTNLDLMQDHASDAVKRVTEPMMKPAREKKAITTRTRRNGSSESAGIEAAKAKAKEREKEKRKEKLKEAGIGRVMAKSYHAPTIIKAMATANSATIVASPTKGQRAGSASIRPWL